MKKLWEVDHPYYCNNGNYYSSEAVGEFKSLADFLDEFADADLDYNAIFRFDWKEGEDNELPAYNGDDNYRNGRLHIYWIGQRKGLFHVSIVEVCRADEPKVREFLLPRYAYLLRLWEPLAEVSDG